MSIRFKQSDFLSLIGKANSKNKKLIKSKWKGKTFTRKEDIIHYEAVQHLKLNYPKVKFQSNHMQGSYKRNLHNVGTLNGTRGLPDLIIFKRFTLPFLAIEIKKPGGRLSKEEIEVRDDFLEQGYSYFVVGDKAPTIEQAVKDVVTVIDTYMIRKV